MALPKSTHERIHRKIRLKRPLKTDEPNPLGKVQPKKTGNNDPNRNHWHKLSEDVLRLYGGEEVECDPVELLECTNKIISVAIDDSNFPLNLSRLAEMKESIQESMMSDPLPVYYDIKLVPEEKQICPHCNEEIREKSIYCNNEQNYHNCCNIPIIIESDIIEDANGNIELLNGAMKFSVNPKYVDRKVKQLTSLYGDKIRKIVPDNNCITIFTEDGNRPSGLPDEFPYLKIVVEKDEK